MIIDLSDDRRSKKPWLPADDRDVTNGLVVDDGHGKPACLRHGAMNRVDPIRSLWRCSEQYCGVGAQIAGGDMGMVARFRDWRGQAMRFDAELVWLADEILDRVPGYWSGRWHARGQWGCTLGLHRYWARDDLVRTGRHYTRARRHAA